MALSGSDQIQRRGKIYSVTNLGIDVALDSFLGNSIEGIFKRGAKDILIKEMGKNGVIEGGTEVSQTLLKYANDWASAPNERAKKEVLAQAVNYVKSGDMFMEFASSFASGAIIGGAGNVVDAKIRPQAKINVKTDMGQITPPTDGGITPPGQTEMAQETIETPQQVETPVKVETTPLEAKTTPEKDSPQDLMEEARKYKTAEEFVKGQGETLYHGSTAQNLKELKPGGVKGRMGEDQIPGIHLTKDYDTASYYARKNGIQINSPVETSFNGKVLVLDSVADAKQKLGLPDWSDQSRAEIPELLKKSGYDGIQIKGNGEVGEIVVTNPNAVKTKSQLTDIWNKAQEKAKEKPKGKETKLGKSIALKAIKDKLIKTYEGVAEYTPTTIDEQAKMSNDLLQNDMEGVRQIFRGQRDLPKGLNPSALVVATETFLKENKIADAPQIVSEMLNSNLVSESSVAGQTLRLLAERDQNSAMAKLQDIKKYREAKATKATNKDAKSVKKNIKKETTKNNLSKSDQN